MNKTKKYYGVRVGRHIGVFDNYIYYRKQVDGFVNAESRRFNDKYTACAYVYNTFCIPPFPYNDNIKLKPYKILTKPVEISKIVDAYIDGSYNEWTKVFSYGCVIINDAGARVNLSGKYEFSSFYHLHNVAGEIMAAIQVMNYCVLNNIKTVNIYYDCEAIVDTLLSNKVQQGLLEKYKLYYESIKNYISINFIKIKGHSGIQLHNEADKLAYIDSNILAY